MSSHSKDGSAVGKVQPQPPIALISGHTDLSPSGFTTHYVPHINTALDTGHRFILGDAAGTDTFALAYLLSAPVLAAHPNIVSRITVYPSRRHNIAALRAQGLRVIAPDHPSLKVERTVGVVGKKGPDARRWHHIQRDANMTAASDYDILFVRSEEESRRLYGEKYRARMSATELNRRRREELKHMCGGQATANSENNGKSW
ncbi:uncharacterized protein JN550_011122 [Neoarthrinium moseri]|uniref:uncharacterized protein n=1 Tax=Neoarthrinium moseri TaxID=1658444 RepID=UPI001FDD2BBD|nr:uncharacterized protein JN550_011122 [Neoarthrinium moseri]KAI1860967.1 hypothetical protein JN550_011122 [Neoarthrinium moseri]